jgi:hypothetical protein
MPRVVPWIDALFVAADLIVVQARHRATAVSRLAFAEDADFVSSAGVTTAPTMFIGPLQFRTGAVAVGKAIGGTRKTKSELTAQRTRSEAATGVAVTARIVVR